LTNIQLILFWWGIATTPSVKDWKGVLMTKRPWLRILHCSALFLTILSTNRLGAAMATEDAPISDPSRPVDVISNNRNFTIRMKSNPSTGYMWFIKQYDPRLLTIVKHEFIPPSGNHPPVGAGGVETWTFEASPAAFIAPMLTQVHFVYARPWELSNQNEVIISVVCH